MPYTASLQELAGPSPVSFHPNPPRRIQGYGNPLWHALEKTIYAILSQDEEYLASGPDGIAPETMLSPGKSVWGSMAGIYTINEASVNHVHAAISKIYNDNNNDKDNVDDYDSDSGAEESVTRGQRAGSEETVSDYQPFGNDNIDPDHVFPSARESFKANHATKRRLTDDNDESDFAQSSYRGTPNRKNYSSKRRRLEPMTYVDEDLNSELDGASIRTATPSPDPVPRKEQKVRQNKKSSNYLPNMSGKRLPAAADNATVAIAAVTRVKWDDEEGVKMFQALKSFQLEQLDKGEPLLKDLHLYSEIAKLMGGGRSAGSCKNYWTRTGRTLFQWDEKKGEHSADVSATSVQKSKKTKQGSSNN